MRSPMEHASRNLPAAAAAVTGCRSTREPTALPEERMTSADLAGAMAGLSVGAAAPSAPAPQGAPRPGPQLLRRCVQCGSLRAVRGITMRTLPSRQEFWVHCHRQLLTRARLRARACAQERAPSWSASACGACSSKPRTRPSARSWRNCVAASRRRVTAETSRLPPPRPPLPRSSSL